MMGESSQIWPGFSSALSVGLPMTAARTLGPSNRSSITLLRGRLRAAIQVLTLLRRPPERVGSLPRSAPQRARQVIFSTAGNLGPQSPCIVHELCYCGSFSCKAPSKLWATTAGPSLSMHSDEGAPSLPSPAQREELDPPAPAVSALPPPCIIPSGSALRVVVVVFARQAHHVQALLCAVLALVDGLSRARPALGIQHVMLSSGARGRRDAPSAGVEAGPLAARFGGQHRTEPLVEVAQQLAESEGSSASCRRVRSDSADVGHAWPRIDKRWAIWSNVVPIGPTPLVLL